MTLTFNKVLDIVDERLRAKFPQAECIAVNELLTYCVHREEKKLGRKQCSQSLARTVTIYGRYRKV